MSCLSPIPAGGPAVCFLPSRNDSSQREPNDSEAAGQRESETPNLAAPFQEQQGAATLLEDAVCLDCDSLRCRCDDDDYRAEQMEKRNLQAEADANIAYYESGGPFEFMLGSDVIADWKHSDHLDF